MFAIPRVNCVYKKNVHMYSYEPNKGRFIKQTLVSLTSTRTLNKYQNLYLHSEEPTPNIISIKTTIEKLVTLSYQCADKADNQNIIITLLKKKLYFKN